ncbi:MAG: aminotransferase class I/II-fold pyridoxal phosphate-dependent enzyme [Bacteroidales bacterium]|nr:aminotransferase class I/II-fold pyridoxal phosphate-dependent enzyme [Bacteroidales bacterium]
MSHDPRSPRPLVPPLQPAAVYVFPDLDAVDAVYHREIPGYIYARDGHPNAAELAATLTQREAAHWGIVTASGMAAISAAILGIVSTGDRILASDRLYGKTTRLLRNELSRLGVVTEFVDICDRDVVREALKKPTRILFTETISNPLCRIADLPALAELTQQSHTELIVDNTFATPELCRPLALGATLVVESLTKLIAGHSDVTLGYVGGVQSANPERIISGVSTWGLASNPFDCWLASRGLETLTLRVQAATTNAGIVADWLAEQPNVARVFYPGRIDHPDHGISSRLLPQGPGNMLAFELVGGRAAVNRWMRACPNIPFAPSLGHTRTTCSHPASTSHRFDPPAEKQRQGISDGLVRLSVGCEPIAELLANLAGTHLEP